MTFGAASGDNWSAGPASAPSNTLQVDYTGTDANGVAQYNVTSPDDGGTQVMRVLAPTNPTPGVAHNFLFVLPVEAGLSTVYGDGLETLRALDAQDQYNLTIIEPSFGIEPWYADNPNDPSVRYETFLTNDLVPWVTQHLATTGAEQKWLIGFSKSGIGATDLILKHPDVFTLAAAWDFPADMSTYDQFGSSSASSYGTNDNFLTGYRLTPSFIEAHKAPFLSKNRIWIGGYDVFQTDMTDFDALLSSEAVAPQRRNAATHATPVGQRLGSDRAGRFAGRQHQPAVGRPCTGNHRHQANPASAGDRGSSPKFIPSSRSPPRRRARQRWIGVSSAGRSGHKPLKMRSYCSSSATRHAAKLTVR